MKLMTEEHQLLCEYSPQYNMPTSVTVGSYNSGQEQLRLSSENFNQVMIEEILPAVTNLTKKQVQELYEIDYYLLLRRLRLVTWGPSFTAASYYCPHCIDPITEVRGVLHSKKRRVRLDTVGVGLPEDNKAIPLSVTIKREELLFCDGDVEFGANRCKDLVLIEKTRVADNLRPLLGIAASLRRVSNEDMFVDITEAVDWLAALPAADFKLLHHAYSDTFKYGLSSRGEVKCQVCGGEAWFFAPVNDYYFRPSIEDLQEWKRILANPEETV